MKTLRFALPSLLGVAMFLAPYPTADGFNIGLGILTDRAGALLGDRLPAIMSCPKRKRSRACPSCRQSALVYGGQVRGCRWIKR